jgi:hypothetical protein
MRARAIVVLSLIMALGCGSGAPHGSDDARVAPPVDAGIPDAAPSAAHRGATRNVAGSVRAASAHYQLVGTTSPGGGPSSSSSYQQRK